MAIQVKAKGNGPNTGMPKTPAPLRPAAPDEVTAIRAPTKAGYGMNSYEGRSSTSPGETVVSPLAANLRASTDDDGVLDAIQKGGVHLDLGWQLRDIGDKNVPTRPHMTGAARGPQIPQKLGAAVTPDPSRTTYDKDNK